MNIIILSVFLILASSKYAAFIYPNQANSTNLVKYQCLAKYVTYTVVMLYQDNNVVASSLNEIALAKQAGISRVDGYVAAFPKSASSYPDAADVVSAVITAFPTKMGIWLDAGNLIGNLDQNKKLLSGMSTLFTANGYQTGIFSGAKYWQDSYGAYSDLSSLNLIYYGNSQSTYLDFTSFGGWTSPSMKLIQEVSDACKMEIAFLYYLPK